MAGLRDLLIVKSAYDDIIVKSATESEAATTISVPQLSSPFDLNGHLQKWAY